MYTIIIAISSGGAPLLEHSPFMQLCMWHSSYWKM